MANLSLAKLPSRLQIAAIVAIGIAVGGGFYFFYEMPQQELITAQSRELSDFRGRISRGQTMARQLPEFRKEIGTLEARLESLKPILPDERDVGDLLRRVQTLAKQSNLQVRGFRPQAITTKEMHAEWPIALELEGNYHNLGLFLDQVSRFPRIINIGGIDVAAKEQPTPQSSITINATATTFVLVDTPPAPAEGPEAKKGAKKALAAAMPAYAQGAKPSPTAKADENAAPAAEQAQVKKADLPVPPPNFEYAAEGRRDPFVSLVNRGKDHGTQNEAATAKRAEGVPGMLTDELTVRGIIQARGAWVAMVAGPDGKVYTVHAGDKLADGVVRQVNAASVVILREVNDPLSLGKQREVRKFLRGGDEVK